ncbi:group III truncated hemoglobin [Hymenobacter latericus]|uniref:group III truncated hemoglobin n=1 Tax=Hymenobacter sp. YIM 151858-1 TaxID=2987688 RepID=UPI002226FE07|nr:group III truncated hemoglobin [Hymenobacter sp. YIM 151858-1]UYZ57996.1 group III truncated hemoglobin [Hymenobacter sp. YIM 151858-1]
MKTTPTSALTDITREADVKTLVDCFCEKVDHDEVLSPVYNAVARVHWPHHLFSMYDFWSSRLLGPQPAPAAAEAPTQEAGLSFAGPHSGRWLNLFNATVQEHFAGPKAEQAIATARTIALNDNEAAA